MKTLDQRVDDESKRLKATAARLVAKCEAVLADPKETLEHRAVARASLAILSLGRAPLPGEDARLFAKARAFEALTPQQRALLPKSRLAPTTGRAEYSGTGSSMTLPARVDLTAAAERLLELEEHP